MIKKSFLLGVFLFCCANAFAGGNSEELLSECTKLEKLKNQEGLVADVHCASYIDGVIDGYRILTDISPQARFICLPKAGLTNEQAIQIFTNWLIKHPNEKNTPARSGVLLSLKETFPCK